MTSPGLHDLYIATTHNRRITSRSTRAAFARVPWAASLAPPRYLCRSAASLPSRKPISKSLRASDRILNLIVRRRLRRLRQKLPNNRRQPHIAARLRFPSAGLSASPFAFATDAHFATSSSTRHSPGPTLNGSFCVNAPLRSSGIFANTKRATTSDEYHRCRNPVLKTCSLILLIALPLQCRKPALAGCVSG